MAILTESEIESLLMATLEGHDPRDVPEEDIEAVADWAVGVRIDAALLRLLLGGEALITSVEADGDFTVKLREEDDRRKL